MFFCPVCHTILKCEQYQTALLNCFACQYSYKLLNIISESQLNSTKVIEKIGCDKDELEFGNLCEVFCPECQNNQAFYHEVQIRSADEPMTIFYKCTKCKYNWKE